MIAKDFVLKSDENLAYLHYWENLAGEIRIDAERKIGNQDAKDAIYSNFEQSAV